MPRRRRSPYQEAKKVSTKAVDTIVRGSRVTASKRLGRKHGYWKDIANVEAELRAFVAQTDSPDVMPTPHQLDRGRRRDLAYGISRYHGFSELAARLNLRIAQPQRRPAGYWQDPKNVIEGLRCYLDQNGKPDVMPTAPELVKAGRSDLANAISLYHDRAEIARQLNLKTRQPRQRRSGYWQDPENVVAELRSHLATSSTPDVMPTSYQLDNAGRHDLAHAIARNIGYEALAADLNLALPPVRKPAGYWNDPDNLDHEVRAFAASRGTPEVMPTTAQFIEANRRDILNAAAKKQHGGLERVRQRLGLKSHLEVNPPGYWTKFSNVEAEVRSFVELHGREGVMPTTTELRAAGRHDLLAVVAKLGFPVVAKKLGLSLTRKENGFWEDWSNLKREILAYVATFGTPGQMPTRAELSEAGRSDLAAAIQFHGGFPQVALRLDLPPRRDSFLSPRSVSEVERIARAVQPLVESNLLSGSQVVVILRRAGMLVHKSPRIARLNQALVRGEHELIEAALASLTNEREIVEFEIAGQTNNENGDAEEADLLLVESDLITLSSDENAPILTKRGPDVVREQAVIRGLSALGEARLPLDEVLTLLTSKLLWEAFYRRLFDWYGAMSATDQIRTEDVIAAILATYPEHLDNEFVAEASERFADEVRQAINFAGSLPGHGWRGPRLRLHQADAARRMADLMIGSVDASTFLLNGDDPGMGKSAAFLAATCVAGLRDVLIVAPKTVADDTWTGRHGEIARCLPAAGIVRGLPAALRASPANDLTFTVLHYEELLNAERLHALVERRFDCLCVDEIHLAKQRANQDVTLRRSALEVLLAHSRVAIGLTGTPLVNELAEPLSLLQLLSQHNPAFDHTRLSSHRTSDIADVFEVLLPHIIRRRKQDVLLHLPGTDVRLLPVPLPADIEREMRDVHAWPRSRAGEALVQLRKLSTEAKLPYLVKRATNAKKLLVLTLLADDVSDRIADYLREFMPVKIGHINGLTPSEERKATINQFREADGLQVLIGTVGTIGVGLTLFDPTSDEMANEIVVADLPYTWAEFEQGIGRLDREGQKRRVAVDVLQATSTIALRDGSPLHTLDEQLWSLIESKRQLSDLAVDGRFEIDDAGEKVQRALRRWLKQARESGVEPISFKQRQPASDAQRWRGEVGRLRAMSSAEADDYFADDERTREFLKHLETSKTSALAHQWLRGKLGLLMRPDLTVVDLGCGLHRLADLPCTVIGVDRHELAGVVRGKMESPPLENLSADVLVYSLSLYGTADDLFSYFHEASRVLRPGGHVLIVEPASSFSPSGLGRFLAGLRGFGFELVSSPRELRDADGMILTALHLTKTGEIGEMSTVMFERK
jgi:superfamily II DNA or RNA helicase